MTRGTVAPLRFRSHSGTFDVVKKRTETPPVSFEAALGELESLVEKMERGDLSLEDSLAAFERGIQLTRTCQEGLNQAEQKVEQLLSQGGQEQIAPFDADDA
jgi:exodeoxyribonuclease VII small subunit